MAALAISALPGARNPHVVDLHSGFCAPGAPKLTALATFFKTALNSDSTKIKGPVCYGAFFMHFMDLGKIKKLSLIRVFTPAKTWAYTAIKHPNRYGYLQT